MRTAWRPHRVIKRARLEHCPHSHCQRPQFIPKTLPVHSVRWKTYDAAIIGAGITGLTAAYRLTQDPNCSKITVYEKSDRVGGWLQSETIPVRDGEVVFEYGPRTLRMSESASMPLLDLIDELGLSTQIVGVPRNAPASTNRYIYYPDHLVRLPGPSPGVSPVRGLLEALRTILTEPLFKGLAYSIIREMLMAPRDTRFKFKDESVGEFISRRFSPEVADNLVSPVFHGIYAGDIDRLSADFLLGSTRIREFGEDGIVRGAVVDVRNGVVTQMLDPELAKQSVLLDRHVHHWDWLWKKVKKYSVITLRRGVAQLTDTLADTLRKSGKVDLLTGAQVTSLRQDTQSKDLVITANGESRQHDRVIASNPSPNLAQLIRQGASLSESGQGQTDPSQAQHPTKTIRLLEEHNYAVTVMVVNLYYSEPDLIPVQGFGYLIPRSIPFTQNPERALGVIFGSDSSVGQDTAPGTKLTVMMGGHWWDGWQESDYPDHETAVEMARSLLERHLQIKATPTVARSRLQRNAIPQYTVGHRDRMHDLSQAVREDFSRRLTLAGSWYAGVGVTDCVTQGYLAASYGVGARKLDNEGGEKSAAFKWFGWDLEGGICTAPVRWARVGLKRVTKP